MDEECFFIIIGTPHDGKVKVPSREARLAFRLPNGHRVLGIFPFNAPELQPEGAHFDATPRSVEGLITPFRFVLPEASS